MIMVISTAITIEIQVMIAVTVAIEVTATRVIYNDANGVSDNGGRSQCWWW